MSKGTSFQPKELPPAKKQPSVKQKPQVKRQEEEKINFLSPQNIFGQTQ